MDRHLSLQTYVPRPLADWIKGKARDQQVSVSIVIRDQLVVSIRRGPPCLGRY
jgi:ribonuclease D